MASRLVAVLGIALAPGCYVGLSDAPAGEGSSASASDPHADGDDDDRDDDGSDGEPADCEGAVGPSPMQRLSRFEYDNVVRDLLGDTSGPGRVLPEDDRVGPFASNTIIDVPEHTVALYAELASQLAANAVGDVASLVGCEPADGAACAASFIATFGRRAYRRPLDDGEIARLLAVYETGAAVDFANGIRLVVEAMLQSPHFLYRVEDGRPSEDATEGVIELDAYELATRVSFFAWRSMPDDALLDAAAAGELDTPTGLRAQAERLLADPRAEEAVAAFHREWLELEGPNGLAAAQKEPTLFPSFGPEMQASMFAEQRAFVADVFAGDASLRTLLTARHTFVDGRLAELYGIAGIEGDELVRVELDPAERIGLLTQGGVLATRAGYSETSPTLRGKLVREAILCETIAPPPPDVNDALPPKADGETKKEQLEAHMSDPSCAGCHRLMDPVGFGFESFDPIGRFRTMDGEFEIDATGEVVSADPQIAGPFDDAIDLVERLAASDAVAHCVVRQWSRFALGREVGGAEATCGIEPAYQAFVESDLDLRELMIEIVALDSFRRRRLPDGEGT
jgi:hypothetical protein